MCRFQYRTERNPCLLYKWLDNGIHLIWWSLQDLPYRQIKITVNISAYTVLPLFVVKIMRNYLYINNYCSWTMENKIGYKLTVLIIKTVLYIATWDWARVIGNIEWTKDIYYSREYLHMCLVTKWLYLSYLKQDSTKE